MMLYQKVNYCQYITVSGTPNTNKLRLVTVVAFNFIFKVKFWSNEGGMSYMEDFCTKLEAS